MFQKVNQGLVSSEAIYHRESGLGKIGSNEKKKLKRKIGFGTFELTYNFFTIGKEKKNFPLFKLKFFY